MTRILHKYSSGKIITCGRWHSSSRSVDYRLTKPASFRWKNKARLRDHRQLTWSAPFCKMLWQSCYSSNLCFFKFNRTDCLDKYLFQIKVKYHFWLNWLIILLISLPINLSRHLYSFKKDFSSMCNLRIWDGAPFFSLHLTQSLCYSVCNDVSKVLVHIKEAKLTYFYFHCWIKQLPAKSKVLSERVKVKNPWILYFENSNQIFFFIHMKSRLK